MRGPEKTGDTTGGEILEVEIFSVLRESGEAPQKYIYILIIINLKYAYMNTSPGKINVKEKNTAFANNLRLFRSMAVLYQLGFWPGSWDGIQTSLRWNYRTIFVERKNTKHTKLKPSNGIGGVGESMGEERIEKIQFGNCCIGFSMATIMFCLHLHALLQNVRTEIFILFYNPYIYIYINIVQSSRAMKCMWLNSRIHESSLFLAHLHGHLYINETLPHWTC